MYSKSGCLCLKTTKVFYQIMNRCSITCLIYAIRKYEIQTKFKSSQAAKRQHISLANKYL